MLILTAAEVEQLLDLDDLVAAVEAAMVELSAGLASMPARVAAMVADGNGLLGAMPAFLPSAGVLATKLVSVFPMNHDRPTHQAVICCFDPGDGTPVALMDGTYVTAARTAAGSALATRILARDDARVASIIGAGVQAASHARALARLPGIESILVAGRDPEKVSSLVADLAASGIPAVPEPSFETAVRTADVVCVATHAGRPVVRREWLRPGTHVNSVGLNPGGDGEVDTETVRDALVVVESRATALSAPPAGAVEIRLAAERGFLTGEDLVEIGELAAGGARGRVDDGQITLYKSVGVAVQDAAAAGLVLRAAGERGIGTDVAV